jgi:D-hydroxyproline dehydrogenase subunit beta
MNADATGDGAFDVIVAGGGIVGAACAAACAHEGFRVALVECDVLGGGTTSAGMGHVVVMDDSEAQFALTRYSQGLWRELAGELPPEAGYETPGTIWLAADEEEMAEAARKQSFYEERGVLACLLSSAELADEEPNLCAGLRGALLVPGDAIVHPPAVALHLARAAQAKGATLILGRRVVHLAAGEAVLDDGTVLRASRLVNAAGPWSPELSAAIPVRKRRGHLAITGCDPGFVRHQLVELGYLKSAHSVSADSVAFNAQPQRSGQLLIGSSRQYGNEDGAADGAMVTAMLERASAYLPSLAALGAFHTRAGFRAATPDKLPLIGPLPADDTVWLATGHEGLGITTSLGTAALLAAAFAGREPAIPAEPYLPARLMKPGAKE